MPHAPGLQQIAELPLAAEGLAHADGDPGLRGVVGQGCEAVHAHRVLVPEGVEGLQRGRDPHCGRVPPQRMQLHHDVHPVSDGGANPAERLQRPVEVPGRDPVTVGLHRRVVERPDLHSGDALLQQAVRQLVGPVEEGVEVFPGAFHRSVESPVVGAPVGTAAHVAVARAGVVGADPVPAQAPQQLVDGLTGRLAEQVPERDVHGGAPTGLGAGAREADVGREVPADALDRERVPAKHRRRRRFVQVRLDRPGTEERLPESREPFVGVHPHPQHVRKLVEPDRLERSDLHASLPRVALTVQG